MSHIINSGKDSSAKWPLNDADLISDTTTVQVSFSLRRGDFFSTFGWYLSFDLVEHLYVKISFYFFFESQ